MQELNQENIVIIIGDLGAGSNVVKNILLLNKEFDWPNVQVLDRLSFIKESIYPVNLASKLDEWLQFEYKFRKFNDYYGVDISDSYGDINTQLIVQKSQNKKIALLCHWPEFATNLKNKYPLIKLVSLYPESKFDLLWQIKTYIDKVSIEKLQNFSFVDNVEAQRKQYMDKFGEEEYYKFNVLNMIEILNRRKESYKNIDGHAIKINSLLSDSSWISKVGKFLNIELDETESIDLLNHWRNLHKPEQEIHDYKWFEKYYAKTN
jgi:hypothetical protein